MTEATALPGVDAEEVDDYRLMRPLGQSGATFLAHDRLLDRSVVLSFLPREPASRATRLAVARALARVAHPNLGRVHRVRDGGARPYVIAAFARGRRLEERGPRWLDARVLALGRDLGGALAALHGAGVAHGDVRAGRVVVSEDGTPRLVGFTRAIPDAPPTTLRADVDALIALLQSIASPDLEGRLGALTGADRGIASAEELRRALETLGRPTLSREALADNPYRGLRAFESGDAAVFFGREREVAELAERLRAQPWLLLAGRSGAGKSSLARAGLAPAIARGVLGERAAWDVATMVPGGHPIAALANALAPLVDTDREELAVALRKDPARAEHLVRARSDRGLLLVVDQLEEAISLASPDERAAFCAALERFGTLAPGVRVVFTVRSDFLDGLMDLGPFGRDLVRAAYIVPTMGRQGLREAIVAPARARGVELETPAMVESLIEEVKDNDEALPMLSFTLAELWSGRDARSGVLREAALRGLGGAVGALANHGDLVLARLGDAERVEAKRILLALVAAADTRVRRTAADLVGDRGAPASTALEALIRGRLVVAGESCEIVHESLARVWPRLRAWLDEASEARAAAGRLAVATREWIRLRRAEGLAGERMLRDFETPGALDGAGDDARAFVAASHAALRRVRLRRWFVGAGIPMGLVLLMVAAWLVSYARHRAGVARAVAVARALDVKAEEAGRKAADARTEAFERFEKDDLGPAEESWKRVIAFEEETDRARLGVGAALDEALALDPRDPSARALYAAVTLARLLAAERLHRSALVRELRGRLDLYDDGSRAALLNAPARVRVETDPPGATLTLARYREDTGGRLLETDPQTIFALDWHALQPGSYLVVGEAPGRARTLDPFFVRRAEERTLHVVLGRAADVPEGMIYVPAGRTLYGSDEDEATRGFLAHQPVHDIDVGAFFIGRTEVTNGAYLAFLASLPAGEREARMPIGLRLSSDGSVSWRLRDRRLAAGQLYCSAAQPCVDWARLPVDGASREDGEHYAAWLAQSGRTPGARLCTDREWERTARGADDRRYPNGNGDLADGEACTLEAYGPNVRAAGPCAVGAHPMSQSPFGVEDMAGNEWEWTAGPADIARPNEPIDRGGSWGDGSIYSIIANRSTSGSTQERLRSEGLRVCASVR